MVCYINREKIKSLAAHPPLCNYNGAVQQYQYYEYSQQYTEVVVIALRVDNLAVSLRIALRSREFDS